MTMDRVYNPHQQQPHGFQQQPATARPTATMVTAATLHHQHQQRHHSQHHIPTTHVPQHHQYLQQQQQQQQSQLQQSSSSSSASPPPPPPPHPLPQQQQQQPLHHQNHHHQHHHHHKHSESFQINHSMQPKTQHLYRGNQYHQQQQSLLDKHQLHQQHQRHHQNDAENNHTQLSINAAAPTLHRPIHPPPPPPPPQQAVAMQHSVVVSQQVPTHPNHFAHPLTTSMKQQKHDGDVTSAAAVAATTNNVRNSLPTVPTRVSDMSSELASRSSLQNTFYPDTHFQYYQPSNLKRHPTHHNKYVETQHPLQQIGSQTVVNPTGAPSAQPSQHIPAPPPQETVDGAIAPPSHPDQSTQDHYTEEVIQAILAAKDALEKPIEGRDEHDILLIDNLCSLVHGFDAFPKSVRRALAAQTVLIVIDEKGKELIVHNEELDSFCVLIFGECEQLDESKTTTLRYYNVGDAFGVCEPTTETIRFFGHMMTRCENCAFLCVKRDDFYTILTDPANYPNKETIRHRDQGGNVVCVSQFSLDRKTTGPMWSYHMQSKPYKIVLPDGHVIIRATEACLLTALVDGYERMDPDYIDDFLLLFRVFMSWDQKERRLPPGMVKLCLTLTKWLDQAEFRDKVVKIVLTWLSSYYHDFELDSDFSYLFFRLLESRLLNLAMNNQLHLLHVTLSTKSKTRRVEIPRPSREQPLFFSIAGGYDKNCGIFVTQVNGTSFDESPSDSLMNYLNYTSMPNTLTADRMGPLGPAIPPRLRSTHNINVFSISEDAVRKPAQLRPGDQILEVNKTNFSAIKLSEAQKVLDSATLLNLTVKYNPSAFHEMRALPEGRRKSSMSSLSSVSPYPQGSPRFTFNMNEHLLAKTANEHHQGPPISPLFSTNANFGFRSLIKNAPKNDRSRLFNLINSSKQLVKQIRDSTAQSTTSVETASKTSDNISDDQSNHDLEMGKTRSSSDLPELRGKDKLESGLSNIVSSDDLNPAAVLESGANGAAGQTLVNVLRVFNAANNDSRYLLIHEETTAREVVMVAVKEFNLTSSANGGGSGSGTVTMGQASASEKTVSSLNWRLYEVSVVPESRTIKKSCLGEQENRLAERNSLCSRFYIKNNAQSSFGPTKLDMGDDALVNEILKESPPSVSLTSLNATLLAVELTLADFDKFRSIEPQQFVYDTFFDTSDKENRQHAAMMSANGSISSHDSASLKSSSSDSQDSSSVADSLHSLNKTRSVPKSWMSEYNKFADISNREMFWVICEILNERNMGRRVKIVKQFVRVADVCSQLRNYNSMFAIISGLGHSCVARLKRTFEKLKPKYKNQLEKMRSLFDPSRNMSNYRICLSNTQPPAIPLFPQIKKDLTFTKEGRSIFVRESNELSGDEDDESGFSQDTIKRKQSRGTPGCDLLTVKSATMTSIDGAADMNLATAGGHTRSMSYSNLGTQVTSRPTSSGSEPENILINFAEIRQFTDRVRNVIYFSSVPYSSDLLTNTKDSQRTQALIKKMHEEWQMRKRIRHYLKITLADSNLEGSPSHQVPSSGRSSQTQSTDRIDQVDGLTGGKQQTPTANGKLIITYDERALYQKSLEVESDYNTRPATTQIPRESEPRHINAAAITPAAAGGGSSSSTLHSAQSMQLHLPPPQVAPILHIQPHTQPLQPSAANCSPTLSKSSSLSSCSSFSHHLPNYHPVRGGANLTSAVGKFGTESTESLMKLRALSENVDDWRSSSCNNNNNNNSNGTNGHQGNGLSRIAGGDGRGSGGGLTRTLVPSRMFPPKNGK